MLDIIGEMLFYLLFDVAGAGLRRLVFDRTKEGWTRYSSDEHSLKNALASFLIYTAIFLSVILINMKGE